MSGERIAIFFMRALAVSVQKVADPAPLSIIAMANHASTRTTQLYDRKLIQILTFGFWVTDERTVAHEPSKISKPALE